MINNNLHDYSDIISLCNPTSKTHQRMSQYNRAAQFAPFAALTGYAEAINETGRVVDRKRELSYEDKELINKQLDFLLKNKDKAYEVNFLYFKKDDKKEGGTYLSKTGIIKSIDKVNKFIKFSDRSILNIDDIESITSSSFNTIEF